jgi:putative ABC transport system ATP-binding protein
MLKLVNVNKLHQSGEVRTAALNGINLEIAAGDYVAIVGPSGCGKSTLLSVLGLLEPASSGAFLFEQQDITRYGESKLNELRRGRIGFIFQSFNLIEELTVFENVEIALVYTGVPAKQRKELVEGMLAKLGIAHRAAHRPSQLSGGQQQRVAIARALVARPKVLLADEPTGNLDSAHGAEVMNILRSINQEGTTVVMVTHSSAHARQAKRVLHMLDGKIVDDVAQATQAAQAVQAA